MRVFSGLYVGGRDLGAALPACIGRAADCRVGCVENLSRIQMAKAGAAADDGGLGIGSLVSWLIFCIHTSTLCSDAQRTINARSSAIRLEMEPRALRSEANEDLDARQIRASQRTTTLAARASLVV